VHRRAVPPLTGRIVNLSATLGAGQVEQTLGPVDFFLSIMPASPAAAGYIACGEQAGFISGATFDVDGGQWTDW
jgi:hypothetical protein